MEKPKLKDVIFKISFSERIVLIIMSVAMIVVSLLNSKHIFHNGILLGMFLLSCGIFGFQITRFILLKKQEKDLEE